MGVLEEVVKTLGVTQVDPKKDAFLFLNVLKAAVREVNEARDLPRDLAQLDEKGRIVIPKKFRTILGLSKGLIIEVFLYPSPDDPKGLLLRRGY